MTPTLTLIIPADWPQRRRDCPWLLHDATGRLLRRGCSEPAQWPAPPADGASCTLLLAGRQTSARRVALPPPPAGHRPAVIGAALEEQLLEAPAQLLFAVDSENPEKSGQRVGIVARARLAALVERLRELGWTPRAAWPLGLCRPHPAAWLCGGELTISHADGCHSLAPDAGLTQWPGLGPELTLHVLDDAPAGRHDETLDRLPRSEQPPLAPAGPGFLYGELAPPRAPVAWLSRLRPAGRLAGLGSLLLVALLVAQSAWFAWQERQLRGRIDQAFTAALPGAVKVDPQRQLERRLADARRQNGQLAADDFLALAAPLAELPAGSLRIVAMDYADGRLRISARLDAENRARLSAAAARRGIALDATSPDELTLTPGETR